LADEEKIAQCLYIFNGSAWNLRYSSSIVDLLTKSKMKFTTHVSRKTRPGILLSVIGNGAGITQSSGVAFRHRSEAFG
jgi:hypothetical protein